VSEENSAYGLSSEKIDITIEPPLVDYFPPKPKDYNPAIALVGTGGISEYHLKNYQKAGYRVTALANRTVEKAQRLRDQFFPEAKVYQQYEDVLALDDIQVVDVTPHPEDRLSILYDCLRAGKHTLSQKPFTLELEEGKKLADLADGLGIKLAVNQNGRWAPHFSYIRNAVKQGLIGEVTSIDFSLQWDQTWIKGIPSFEEMKHLILFDFAIHWFDITACIMGDQKPISIFASVARHANQVYNPPALASVIIEYPQAQVRMSFNAHCTLGEQDTTTIVGTHGTLRSRGPGLNEQPSMEVFLEKGFATVPLQGCWFESGFEGTMGELLCAIEEDRSPYHSAKNNLKTLELCFAAQQSADQGTPVDFG
jgi:predicted dehydrogenase